MDAISAKSSYKWCIVPNCTSTTIATPKKHFISVPSDPKRRILWIRAVRRGEGAFSPKSTLFVCQDHFKLEEDMENYTRFVMMGGSKKMKKDVVPHIFKCQEDRRRRAFPTEPRPAAVKRARKQTVLEAVQQIDSALKVPTDEAHIATEYMSEGPPATDNTPGRVPPTRDRGIQYHVPYKSKAVQAVPVVKSSACSPFKIHVCVATSPTKPGKKPNRQCKDFYESDSDKSMSDLSESKSQSDSDTDYKVDSGASDPDYVANSSADSDCKELDMAEFRAHSLKRSLQLMSLKPRLYLGLCDDCKFMIPLLERQSGSSKRDIYLTLKKIRTNQTFEELGDDFGMSKSNASRIFAKTLPLLSSNFSQLIFWPAKEKIKQLLPIAFRVKYSNVQCILDCFEIEIEKPSDAIHQSQTWSSYKKCNTLKYLLGITPSGHITFVSTGYAGRTSDTVMVKTSGLEDALPWEAGIMADRGFKHIRHILARKNCTLVRPPSVSSGIKLTKEECLLTKKIGSTRIHVERAVRRIREFKALKPHACMNKEIIPYADHMITVATGLVNLEGPLIR